MIPTMIVFGLVLGRWWRTAIVSAAVVWPLLLLATGVVSGTDSWLATLLLGGLLAAVNATVGVAVHQLLLALVRLVRRRRRPAHS